MRRIVGRYEAWRRLSQGGMSEIWLARHEALSMPVIVKTIRPAIANAVPEAEAMLVGTRAARRALVLAPRRWRLS